MKYTRKSFSVVAGGTDEYRAGYDAIDWGNGTVKEPGFIDMKSYVYCDLAPNLPHLYWEADPKNGIVGCQNPRKAH